MRAWLTIILLLYLTANGLLSQRHYHHHKRVKVKSELGTDRINPLVRENNIKDEPKETKELSGGFIAYIALIFATCAVTFLMSLGILFIEPTSTFLVGVVVLMLLLFLAGLIPLIVAVARHNKHGMPLKLK